MELIAHKLDAKDWSTLSQGAHFISFNEKRDGLDRIDYAVVIETDDSRPMSWMTIKEIDSESAYLQHGGAFPDCKGSIHSFHCYLKSLAEVKLSGNYKRFTTRIENTNKAMLKFAAKVGFIITGVSVFKGAILLEHLWEF